MAGVYPGGGASRNGDRPVGPRSGRLRYRRLAPGDVGALQQIAWDAHVRRFLLDGHVVAPDWAAGELARSDALFAERGVGLWMVRDAAAPTGAPVGFVGFRHFEGLPRELQLLYGFLPAATGRGYATEAAGAALRFASDPAGPAFDEVDAAVDEPNAASSRVLTKLGFECTGDVPGAFGRTLTYRWRAPRDAASRAKRG